MNALASGHEFLCATSLIVFCFIDEFTKHYFKIYLVVTSVTCINRIISFSGKTLPVHCVVEAVSSLEEGAWRRRSVVETDSYVIIPAATAFHELVPAAMMRLGYPHELSASAKGGFK